MKLALAQGAEIVGIVGRDGGELRKVANASIVIPSINAANITTQVEGFQALLWHLIVCHPMLEGSTPKWESII
jgi:D-sedoheptulose 7-phosphate isomerase